MPPGLSNCNPDPYFASDGCTAVVKAYVTFASGATTSGSGKNAFVTINGVDAVAGTDAGGPYWTAAVPVGAESGPNPIVIDWKQKFGTRAERQESARTAARVQGCSGSFDVAQQSFGATNDEDVTNSGDHRPRPGRRRQRQLRELARRGHAPTASRSPSASRGSRTRNRPIRRSSCATPTRTRSGPGSSTAARETARTPTRPRSSTAARSGVYIWPEGTACVLPNSESDRLRHRDPRQPPAEDRERDQGPDQRRLQLLERLPRQRLVRHQQLHPARRSAGPAADHHRAGGPRRGTRTATRSRSGRSPPST